MLHLLCMAIVDLPQAGIDVQRDAQVDRIVGLRIHANGVAHHVITAMVCGNADGQQRFGDIALQQRRVLQMERRICRFRRGIVNAELQYPEHHAFQAIRFDKAIRGQLLPWLEQPIIRKGRQQKQQRSALIRQTVKQFHRMQTVDLLQHGIHDQDVDALPINRSDNGSAVVQSGNDLDIFQS